MTNNLQLWCLEIRGNTIIVFMLDLCTGKTSNLVFCIAIQRPLFFLLDFFFIKCETLLQNYKYLKKIYIPRIGNVEQHDLEQSN